VVSSKCTLPRERESLGWVWCRWCG